MPWLAGIAWVGHGSPVCLPTTCLLSSDSGGPVKAKEGSAPSFPGGATVEPEALWLEMMIKDGKLVWMRRGCGKGGPRGALVPGRESLALEIGQSRPHQPNSLPNGLERQFWWERTLPRRQGKPCCSGGCGPSCHAWEGGRANPGQRAKGAPSPHSVGESMGHPLAWAYCPLGMKGSPSPGSG